MFWFLVNRRPKFFRRLTERRQRETEVATEFVDSFFGLGDEFTQSVFELQSHVSA